MIGWPGSFLKRLDDQVKHWIARSKTGWGCKFGKRLDDQVKNWMTRSKFRLPGVTMDGQEEYWMPR
jgi:hypothetical protein